MNEADTCRRLVRPLIEAAGWDASPHCCNEQIGRPNGRLSTARDTFRNSQVAQHSGAPVNLACRE